MPYEKLRDKFPDVVEVRFNKNPIGKDESTLEQKWIEDFDWADVDWADVVVVNNIFNFGGPYTARVCGKVKERGKFFHYDTDDLLTEIYDGHRLQSVYHEGRDLPGGQKEQPLAEITKFIYHHSDLITVTQRKFLHRIQPYFGPRTMGAVIKNAIDYDLPCWNAEKTPPFKKNLCRFGWVGGIHHEEDVKEFTGIPNSVNGRVGRENVKWDFYGKPPRPLNPATGKSFTNREHKAEASRLKALADMASKGEKSPDNYALITAYHDWVREEWQQEVWQNYENILMRGFKGQKNYQVYHALPASMYGLFYTQMDAAIAPLQMNEFNDSKSEIKVAEAGRYQVPLIASNVGCYDEWIVNGETGYLIDPDAPKKEWIAVLSKVAKDKKLRERMGRNLHELTEENFNINKTVDLRLDLYEYFYDNVYNKNTEPANAE